MTGSVCGEFVNYLFATSTVIEDFLCGDDYSGIEKIFDKYWEEVIEIENENIERWRGSILYNSFVELKDIEKENLGGICLNWGCIPTKALLKSAQVFEYLNHAEDFGITVKEAK